MMIWVINRQGQTVGLEQCTNAKFGEDCVDKSKSSFPLVNPTKIYQKGDFMLAKKTERDSFNFFGVIDSYEDETLVCNDISILANFDIPTGKISGPSFEQHYLDLLNKYLFNDPTKGITNVRVEVKTNTQHLYQPAETPSSTNLMKYLVNAFKKYNIVWQFDRFEDGIVYTYLEAVKESFQLKNNIDDFRDWKISTTEVGKDTENMLYIIDKTTTDMMNPKVLATYYLTTDNEVTTNVNDTKIIKPTRSKVNIYDKTQTNAPSYEQVAKSELKSSFYSHEINVSASVDNAMINMHNIKVGLLATIYYNDRIYKSVLSGYEYEEGSDTIDLKFGNIRSRISELLE